MRKRRKALPISVRPQIALGWETNPDIRNPCLALSTQYPHQRLHLEQASSRQKPIHPMSRQAPQERPPARILRRLGRPAAPPHPSIGLTLSTDFPSSGERI